MNFIKCFLLVFFGVIIFSILHDLITANICLEYFTKAHVKVISSENPFILALFWGVFASWWLALPIAFSIAMIIHHKKSVSFIWLRKKIITNLSGLFLLCVFVGIIGFTLSKFEIIRPSENFLLKIGNIHWENFFYCIFSHTCAYVGGILVGGLLIFQILKKQNINNI